MEDAIADSCAASSGSLGVSSGICSAMSWFAVFVAKVERSSCGRSYTVSAVSIMSGADSGLYTHHIEVS